MSENYTHNQILRWAANILAREAQSQLFGSVTFSFQQGRIITVKTERTEKPILDDFIKP